jgi:hypothetical protein
VRTVAFRFEKTAAFQHDHTYGEQKESNTPPVEFEFFHSKDF